jgi:hypothetical protein
MAPFPGMREQLLADAQALGITEDEAWRRRDLASFARLVAMCEHNLAANSAVIDAHAGRVTSRTESQP